MYLDEDIEMFYRGYPMFTHYNITSASHAWTIPCAIQSVAAIVITVVVAMVAVVVAALVMGAVVNTAVELLLIGV